MSEKSEEKGFVELNTDASKVAVSPNRDNEKCKPWEKPVLEDVSGKVMAQPYIRFT